MENEKKICLDDTLSGTKEKLEMLTETSESKDEEIIISFTHGGNNDEGLFEKCTISTLVDTLFSRNVSDGLTTADIILIENNSVYCSIDHKSYSWWGENGKRKNQLRAITGCQPEKKTVAKKQETKEEVQPEVSNKDKVYAIAIADLTEEGLTHIDFYEGKKVECMSWLNAQILRHYDIKEQSVMVFDLEYIHAHNDDITKWFTIEELVGQGRVILK